MVNPYIYMKKPAAQKQEDLNAPSSGRDQTPVSKAVIKAVLNKKPPKNVFQPALNRSAGALRFMGNSRGRATRMPQNVRLEAPSYPFKEIDKVIPIESMVLRAFYTITSNVMPGVDSFHLEGMNEQAVKYVERRLEEITAPLGESPYSLVRKIVENIIKKSNAVVWIRRVRASEKKYKYLGLQRNTIKAVEVIDVSQVDVARNDNDEVVGFHLSTQTTDKLIKWRDAYLMRYQRISNDHLFGCPFVLPVLDDILSLRRLEEMLDMALGKATFPLYHLAIGDDNHPPMVYGENGRDTDISRARAQFEGMAPEGMYVSPGWHKLEIIQPRNVGDFKPYLEWYRERIFMGLLMDGPTMGVGSTANRNTANTMSDSLLTKVRDIQTEVAEQLTRGLIRELLVEGGFEDPIGEDAVHFVFKDNDREGRMAYENQIMGLYQGNMLTQDEARKLLGRRPMSPEDLQKGTFLAYSSELQQKVETTKLKARTQSSTQPSNQHGTSKSKPKAAKRKDAFSRMANMFISTYDVNPTAAKAVLESQSRRLAEDLMVDLSVAGIGGRKVKTDVKKQVDSLVKNILGSVDPKKKDTRQVVSGLRYKVDHIYDNLIEKYNEEIDA